jgi:ribosomal protein L25 (general stress protein Ctc)
MLERFLACRRRSRFSAQKKAFKNLVYSNAHTVVIDLGNGKSFTAILKTFQVHPVTRFYILTSSNL